MVSDKVSPSVSPRLGDEDDEILIDFASPDLSHVAAAQPRSDVALDDGGETPQASPSGLTTTWLAVDGGKLPIPKQSRTPPPTFDMAVADDGEILFVGPNYTGTQPFSGGGNFGEYPRHSQTTPGSANMADDDDGEILLVGPNCTAGTRHFLDGGKFGKFPSEIGIRKTTNPFLADILSTSTSSHREPTLSNGIFSEYSESREQYPANDDTVGPDTGTGVAFRPSPFTGRVLPPAIGHSEASLAERWSPGCGEVTRPLSSFRPQDAAIESSPSSLPIGLKNKASLAARWSPGRAGEVRSGELCSPLLSSFRPQDIMTESTRSCSPIGQSEAVLSAADWSPGYGEVSSSFSAFHPQDIAIPPIGESEASLPARWSSGSGEVSVPLSSFRPWDVANEPASSLPAAAAAAGPGVLRETDLDDSILLSTSPVAFVVS